jgi:poly(beta-D-mannuronate) lyase
MQYARHCSWIVGALVTVTAAYAQKAALRSPWDAYTVTTNETFFSCLAPSPLPSDFATNSYFTDRQHSIPDPLLHQKHKESVAHIEEFSRAVVGAADAFQTKGSRAAAECVVSLLENAASQNALGGRMYGRQAIYVQGKNLGAWAVAFLKVRGSSVASEEQSKNITTWLNRLATVNRTYYDARRQRAGPNDAYSHLLYWAGFAVGAVAIANDDQGLFRWAMDTYVQGVNDIREDGTLPIEMDRGQLALHSHLYALAPLIMLAEFGEVNGLDLYAERNFAIKRLIAVCVGGLEDPSFFQRHTGVVQVTEPEIEPWEISWAKPYTHRFPNPRISELLAKATRLNYTMLGGLPPI